MMKKIKLGLCILSLGLCATNSFALDAQSQSKYTAKVKNFSDQRMAGELATQTVFAGASCTGSSVVVALSAFAEMIPLFSAMPDLLIIDMATVNSPINNFDAQSKGKKLISGYHKELIAPESNDKISLFLGVLAPFADLATMAYNYSETNSITNQEYKKAFQITLDSAASTRVLLKEYFSEDSKCVRSFDKLVLSGEEVNSRMKATEKATKLIQDMNKKYLK
jgi:hypothetical protein